MRRRGAQAGPVRLHRFRRSGARVRSARRARTCSSACGRRDGPPPLRRCSLLRAARRGNRDANLLLLDARRLAGEVAEVVQLRATHATAADDREVADHRAVHGEDALHADAVRDLANGEGLADATAAAGDAYALERLQTLLLAFTDSHVH